MDSIGKLDTVDTRLISTFTALTRTSSFTAAVTELHLAQSTVTAHIQALEWELRARLVDRLPSGATLTETGRRTLERAQLVLDAEAALRTEAASDCPIEGEVTVGATESLCAYLLPGAIAALHASHPGVDVRLTPSGTAGTVERLRDGRISVGLILEPALRAPDLVVQKAGPLDLGFACAPDHELAGRKAGWTELAEHRRFLLEEGCTYSDDVARELAAGEHSQITRLGKCRSGARVRRGGAGSHAAADVRARRPQPRRVPGAAHPAELDPAGPACPALPQPGPACGAGRTSEGGHPAELNTFRKSLPPRPARRHLERVQKPRPWGTHACANMDVDTVRGHSGRLLPGRRHTAAARTDAVEIDVRLRVAQPDLARQGE